MQAAQNSAAAMAVQAQPRPEFAPLRTTPIGHSADPHSPLTNREARRLVNEIRDWARQFDAPDACALVHAMNDMERLLIRVWTEIDESMLRLAQMPHASTPERAEQLRKDALRYLNRWTHSRPQAVS